MVKKRKVAIGFLGSRLDNITKAQRHTSWRPTISLIKSAEVRFDRLELITSKGFEKLLELIKGDLAELAPRLEVREHCLEQKDPWNFEETYSILYDFAERYPFDPEQEDYYIHITTGTHVAQICLFILTADGFLPGYLIQTSPSSLSEKEGEMLTKEGIPRDKSIGVSQVIDLDLSRYEMITSRFNRRREQGGQTLKAGIQTRNAEFNELISEIESVAGASRDTILLTGPTGAGKTKLAEKIFDLKLERKLTRGRFVSLNCATLRGDMAMSALFGHAKGAFTGAIADKKGLLDEANGGVLFLDEIGELGLSEQAMLLHAIESGVYRPVGSQMERRSEFQLICGTNRDLLKEVEEGRFREDLLSRINIWQFRLPSLAERREDIEPNLNFEIAAAERRHGRKFLFAQEARTAYLNFAKSEEAPWRGNFRDLSASVQRITTLCLSTGRVDLKAVQREISRLKTQWGIQAEVRQEVKEMADLAGRYLDSDKLAKLPPRLRHELSDIISACLASKSLSEAGRKTHAHAKNPCDSLKKYLKRYGLEASKLIAGS